VRTLAGRMVSTKKFRLRINQPPIGPPKVREKTCVRRSDFGHAKVLPITNVLKRSG